MLTLRSKALREISSSVFEGEPDKDSVGAKFQEVSRLYDLCFDPEICDKALQYALLDSTHEITETYREILDLSLASVSCLCLALSPLDGIECSDMLARVCEIVWPERWLCWMQRKVHETSAVVTCRVTRQGEDVEDLLQAILDTGVVAKVEELLTCPCEIPILELDFPQLTVPLSSVDPLQVNTSCDLFSRFGLLVSNESLISQGQILEFLEKISLRIRVVDDRLKSRGVSVGVDAFKFKEIGSRGPQRFDLLLQMPEFDELARTAAWVPVVEHFLGDVTTLHIAISVVYSRPGAPDQYWHADGPHLSPTPWNACSLDERSEADPYAICAFLPLVDLSQDVGFTQFWPGSHKHEQLIGFGEACPIVHSNYDAIVTAGDCVLYDYRLIHRGMGNRSDMERPILQFLYHKNFYHESHNYGTEYLFS